MLLRHTGVVTEGSTLQVGAADGKCRPQLVRLKHYTEKLNLNSFIEESVCRSLEAWSETKDWQQAQPIRGGGWPCVTSLCLLWSPALRMTSQISVGIFQTNKIFSMIQSEASLRINLKWLFQFCKKKALSAWCHHFNSTEKQTERRPTDSNPP